MLTFIEERRQRIRKAREEGFEEGFKEGRAEGFEEGRKEGLDEVREERHKEIIRILSSDPRIAELSRKNPKIRERLRELGIEPPSRRDCD